MISHELISQSVGRSPFHQWLQCRLESVDAESGCVRIGLPFRPEMARSPGQSMLHGGIVAALADLTAHAALFAQTGVTMPTIDLRIDYLRPAHAPLMAAATPRRVGRNIGIADIEVFERDGKLAALGRAVFRIEAPASG